VILYVSNNRLTVTKIKKGGINMSGIKGIGGGG